MKKLFKIIIFLSALCISLISNVLADTQTSFTAGNGWAYLEGFNHAHVGTKTFKYKIDNLYSNTRPQGYDFDSTEIGYITTGKGLWGTNLSLTETSSGVLCTIRRQYLGTGVAGEVQEWAHVYDNDTNHITSSLLYLSTDNWPFNSTKAPKIVAHELGHVVGLAHVSNSTQIMNKDALDSISVTNNDIKGMKAMTHGCTTIANKAHDTYTFINAVLCQVNCTACGVTGYDDHLVPNPSYTTYSSTDHKVGQCVQCSKWIYETHVLVNNKCIYCGRVV